METFEFIEKTDINNLLKILFIMSNFNDVLRSLYRLAKMIEKSSSIILLLFSTLLIFGIFSRVIFDGTEIGEDDDALIFMYSFTSFWRSFETMFITILMANFPDIVIDAYNVNAIYALYFIFYIFFAAIVIFGMVVGVFGANY